MDMTSCESTRLWAPFPLVSPDCVLAAKRAVDECDELAETRLGKTTHKTG